MSILYSFILLKDLELKGATIMINEIERIKEEQKMQVLNETILALLCIDKNGYDLKNRYLIGAEEKFNEDLKNIGIMLT